MQTDQEIHGIVKRVTFASPDGQYSIIKINEQRDPDTTIAVVLNGVSASVGGNYKFNGKWVTHKKFGKQFQASRIEEVAPDSIDGLKKYLGSGVLKGVGPKTAARIVDHFGEQTLDILNETPEKLLKVSGVSKKKLESIVGMWQEQKHLKDSMMALQKYDLGSGIIGRIIKKFKEESVNVVTGNPYILAQQIRGIGFATADEIAKKVGIKDDDPKRLKAAISHVISNAEGSGHCYLTKEQIFTQTLSLLKMNEESKVEEALIDACARDEIIKLNIENESYYYNKRLFFAERQVGQTIKEFSVNKPVKIMEEIAPILDKIEEDLGLQLSSEQRGAVEKIYFSPFSILTGGPGCGKTTTLRILVQLLKKTEHKVVLAAPTGRAAQRMEEVCGFPAQTIHRLLEYTPEQGGFKKNAESPLTADFVIIDESSMLDTALASNLVSALPKKGQVLFLGDPDQLPSVGPGNVLADLINSEAVNVYKLKKVFRQASESTIIEWAHAINEGEIPKLVSPLKDQQAWDHHDCLFLDSALEESGANYHPNTLDKGFNGPETLVRLYTKTIAQKLGPEAEIQILSPQIRGSMGTENLNKLIQERVNPKTSHKKEIEIGQKLFRVGDRVIQTKNNYDLGVFNGEIGRIKTIEDDVLTVSFKNRDNEDIHFEGSDQFDLNLAYAITIHKSQGSEFDAVIVPIYGQHFMMLYRNLIYTGLTRGKKLVTFLGERKALAMAVNKKDGLIRQTNLSYFLNEN